MKTALHRTDVDHVWPHALVRPSGVRLVYLDQNHWINLAKAAVGKPVGRPYRDALEVLREAQKTGRAVLPLSLTHVMETSTIPRRQRGDVATVMEELSGFTALISRAVVMRLELESALDAVTESGPSKYNSMPIVGAGMAYAYGKRGGFRVRRGRQDVTDEMSAQLGPDFDRRLEQAEQDLNRAILRGPTSDTEEMELRANGWNPEIAFRIGDERARAETEQAARFSDPTLVPDDPTDYRRERVRDVIRTRYVIVELMEMVNETLAARGLEIEDVWTGADSARRLVDAMPSADVAVTLLTEYHRDATFKWRRNHIFDIDALSVAVPYCDIVATDKQAVDALRRARIMDRTGTHVVKSLEDVADALT